MGRESVGKPGGSRGSDRGAGGDTRGGRRKDSTSRGGATPDPAFSLDPDPVDTDSKRSPVADPSASSVASSPTSPERPAPAEALHIDPKSVSLISSGVLSIETDPSGVQSVKIIDTAGKEHRYSLDLLRVLGGPNKEVPHDLIKEIGDHRKATDLRIDKLRILNAPEAKVRPKLAELAMLDKIIATVLATTPTLAESRAAAQATVAAERAAAEKAAAARAAAARAEAIKRAEEASEVNLGEYTIRLGINNDPDAGPNKGKMVIKIVHTVDIDGQSTPVTDLYALNANSEGNVLNLPDDIVSLVQQARQSLFDRHVSALKAEADRLGARKGRKAGVAAQVPEQAIEQVPAPADAEITEVAVEEPVKLSRQELNQLNTLTEIEVAYINAIYQDQYAGGKAKGKKDMLDMPRGMWNTVKDLVSYFGSRRLSEELDVFLSPAELRQRKVLLPIYTAHTAQVEQARAEYLATRMAAEREYQRLQAVARAGAGKGKEAKPRNIPRELQHNFHREIPADALQMAQNPGGFLIKSGRGQMFAIQIAQAMSGKKNAWEVYVVSDGGSGYIQEEQTFEVVRKGGPQGNRLEMKGMSPVIAQGLETFVSVVGVGSLSQDLKAFYDAHMQVKTEREVQQRHKPRPAPEKRSVR